MREITETHIIELIKKHAQGGSFNLFDYFKGMNISLACSHDNILCFSVLDIDYEMLDWVWNGLVWRFRARIDQPFHKIIYPSSTSTEDYDWLDGDVIPAGTSIDFLFPSLKWEERDGEGITMFPVVHFGDQSMPNLYIPPLSKQFNVVDSDGNNHTVPADHSIGRIMAITCPNLSDQSYDISQRLGLGVTDDEDRPYSVPDDIAEAFGYDPDTGDPLIDPIGKYLSYNTSSKRINVLTIDGVNYTLPPDPSMGYDRIGPRVYKLTLTVNTALTYVDPYEHPDETHGFDHIWRVNDKYVTSEVWI